MWLNLMEREAIEQSGARLQRTGRTHTLLVCEQPPAQIPAAGTPANLSRTHSLSAFDRAVLAYRRHESARAGEREREQGIIVIIDQSGLPKAAKISTPARGSNSLRAILPSPKHRAEDSRQREVVVVACTAAGGAAVSTEPSARGKALGGTKGNHGGKQRRTRTNCEKQASELKLMVSKFAREGKQPGGGRGWQRGCCLRQAKLVDNSACVCVP